MTRKERIRRTALVCCHFGRNLAYYRAGWEEGKSKNKSEFWKTANSNFLDLAIIEWCKLFGSQSEKHHWKNIAKHKTNFKNEMLDYADIDISEFESLWRKVKVYRDKFVAHLDSEEIMHIPLMEHTLSTASFYYDRLRVYAEDGYYLDDLPLDLNAYYEHCYREACEHYDGQET